MSGNSDMNGWIRQAMTPKHALETFVGLLNGQDQQDDQEGQQGGQGTGTGSQGGQQAQDPPRRRVNADAGEGQGLDAQPEAGGTAANQVMNRLLKDAIRNKERS